MERLASETDENIIKTKRAIDENRDKTIQAEI